MLPNLMCLATGNLKRTSAWYIFIKPLATFYHVAAPLISYKTGLHSWNGTPFFTSFINLTLKNLESTLCTANTCIFLKIDWRSHLWCHHLEKELVINRLIELLQRDKWEIDSHRFPILRDYQQVQGDRLAKFFSSNEYIDQRFQKSVKKFFSSLHFSADPIGWFNLN